MPEPRPLATAAETVFRYVGSAFGAVAAAQIGDPLVGAAVGEVIGQAANDFATRMLSVRQERRVATVVELAAVRIGQRVRAGDSLRDDGLFDAVNAEATEIVEGVMLAARDEHQEKKLPYLANLLTGIAFYSDVSVEAANLILRDAEQMSWLEMCVLSIVHRSDEYPLPDHYLGDVTSWGDWPTKHAFRVLMSDMGYLFPPEKPRGPGDKLALRDLRMSAIQLTNRGLLLSALMGLDTIPATDLEAIYASLVSAAAIDDEASTTP